MIECANIRLPLDAFTPGARFESFAASALAEALSLPKSAVTSIRLLKRSVDARRKSDVHFVCTFAAALPEQDEARLIAQGRAKHFQTYEPLAIPDCSAVTSRADFLPPYVVGAGPAGLFAALYLARAGLRPVLIERGSAVEKRASEVEAFASGAVLNPECNVQFGEGGAGAFSDGKLTTQIKSPYTRHVLQLLAEAGAPQEILWQAKPHVGTDLLPSVLRSLREQIIAAGGTVCFDTRLEELVFDEGQLAAVRLCASHAGECGLVPVRQLVLACGHSARDTFAMLHEVGLAMEPKPFSLGVRIEHKQAAINRVQYGAFANHPALGAADYKLSVQVPSSDEDQNAQKMRGVYTFCMCPGGEVLAAASEEGMLAVNGMSRFARDGANANSALLVSVTPDDFPPGVLGGVALQRRIERAAYLVGEQVGRAYAAPAQRVGDFLAGCASTGPATLLPSYPRGVVWGDLHSCLPSYVCSSLATALPLLDRKLHGFTADDAVMTGVETRSSSPVRILRNDNLQAEAPRGFAASGGCGLYPCGEGVGYAGGIMSAACDGLRVASALTNSLL